MKRILFVVYTLILFAATSVNAAYNDPNQGNPIIPGYFADPSIHKFGSTWYIYGSRDGGVPTTPPVVWRTTNFQTFERVEMAWTNGMPPEFWGPYCY